MSPNSSNQSKKLYLEHNFACLLTLTGSLECWWDSNIDHKYTIYTPKGYEQNTVSVSLGKHSLCAIKYNLILNCWLYRADKE